MGKNWGQMYWSKPLDTQRAKGLNRAAVDDWFWIVKEQIIDQGIDPGNIYRMDESGFPPSKQGTQHEVGHAKNKNYKIQHTLCARVPFTFIPSEPTCKYLFYL